MNTSEKPCHETVKPFQHLFCFPILVVVEKPLYPIWAKQVQVLVSADSPSAPAGPPALCRKHPVSGDPLPWLQAAWPFSPHMHSHKWSTDTQEGEREEKAITSVLSSLLALLTIRSKRAHAHTRTREKVG